MRPGRGLKPPRGTLPALPRRRLVWLNGSRTTHTPNRSAGRAPCQATQCGAISHHERRMTDEARRSTAGEVEIDAATRPPAAELEGATPTIVVACLATAMLMLDIS